METKKIKYTNFSRTIQSQSQTLRPDWADQIALCFEKTSPPGFLARGQGLSYNDCCLNTDGYIIDNQRLGHFLDFNPDTGIAICQPAVSFSDLFQLHPDFIPPVIPGTIHATLAGGFANDVHGKNNPTYGTFADHVDWISLQTGKELRRCSRREHPELFHATAGGLGLTGVISEIALKLRKSPRYVSVKTKTFTTFSLLMQRMDEDCLKVDYQAAWLDLLNNPSALLFQANNADTPCLTDSKVFSLPPIPVRLIHRWTMKCFNRWYAARQRKDRCRALTDYNNPLDSLGHWNRLYGPKGLIQFQGLFPKEKALETLQQLLETIKQHKATPTLAVLKVFTRKGLGLLSFCEPGFTLAIDFIHNQAAREAIKAMNQFLCEHGGKVYLAKDNLLTKEQFQIMYPDHGQFSKILKGYQSPMQSDLARRLGVIK